MVRDLTDTALCEKNNEAALEAKANGNISFSIGDYSSALRFYSQVLKYRTFSKQFSVLLMIKVVINVFFLFARLKSGAACCSNRC